MKVFSSQCMCDALMHRVQDFPIMQHVKMLTTYNNDTCKIKYCLRWNGFVKTDLIFYMSIVRVIPIQIDQVLSTIHNRYLICQRNLIVKMMQIKLRFSLWAL